MLKAPNKTQSINHDVLTIGILHLQCMDGFYFAKKGDRKLHGMSIHPLELFAYPCIQQSIWTHSGTTGSKHSSFAAYT